RTAVHVRQRTLESQCLRRVLGSARTGHRRKPEQLRSLEHPGTPGQLRLDLGDHLPYVAINASALRQPRSHGSDHVAVTVGEERVPEEFLRPPLPFRGRGASYEVPRTTVRG